MISEAIKKISAGASAKIETVNYLLIYQRFQAWQ
jgi:hypothetical protein